MSRLKTKLYLAYGSNLNINQMAHRCPSATLMTSGLLKDHQLLFRGYHEHALATVELFNGSSVPVLIWKITQSDEAALDIYEGFPNLYRKETVVLQVDCGKTFDAMIYIMNTTDSDGRPRPLGKPGKHYFNIIMEAYRHLATNLECSEFDVRILHQAATKSSNRRNW